MTILDKTILIENLFLGEDFTSEEFNNIVINKISVHSGWYLSNDEQRQKQKVDEEYSDSGMLLESYYDSSFDNRNITHNKNNEDINMMANLILEKILLVLPFEFKNLSIVRYLWNYYNRSSTGVSHKDIDDKNLGNYCSIVYHLNTCDGQTIIDDNEFESKSGQCVIFDSKKIHRGTGPKVNPKRYCLNIIFKYDSIIDK